MPVEISWGDPEKSIIFTAYNGNWTLEEYHAMIDTMHLMILSVDHPVYLISDFSGSQTSPAKLLSSGRHMQSKSVPTKHRIPFSVMVNASGFLQALAGVVQKLFLKEAKMYFVGSVDEAYHLVESHQRTSGQSHSM